MEYESADEEWQWTATVCCTLFRHAGHSGAVSQQYGL